MPPLRLVNEYSYEDGIRAYFDCRKHKAGTLSALAFEADFERKLDKLVESVNLGTYEVGRSRVFVVERPKPREVWAAQFHDRIIHHLIYRDIGPYFFGRCIEDNFACIPGRGNLAASKRAEEFMRRATENWAKPAYVLQMDIANFFVSINKNILWGIMRKHIGEESLSSRLTKQVLYHSPTINPIIVKKSNFNLVPKHKSLWNTPKEFGLAIGDFPSQLEASGIYLDGMDKLIKHTLKAKYYVRYVDDAIIVHRDRDYLYYCMETIDTWLRENRGLHLKRSKTRIVDVNGGINFIGRVILPYRAYTRRMTVGNATTTANRLHKWHFDKHDHASLCSYLGILRHGNNFNTRKKLCLKSTIGFMLGCDKQYTKVFSLI